MSSNYGYLFLKNRCLQKLVILKYSCFPKLFKSIKYLLLLSPENQTGFNFLPETVLNMETFFFFDKKNKLTVKYKTAKFRL